MRSALGDYPEEVINILITKLEDNNLKEQIKKQGKFEYSPFEGHQSRLSHYFRHLYQTVKYVDKQELDIDKYEYVRILRSQLSIDEEALLMFNSVSRLGATWEKDNLITKYRLIKHIPKDFSDSETEINVKSIFPSLLFRWEETSETDLQN